jgi:tetratricopeptide (TPR) repeat protein
MTRKLKKYASAVLLLFSLTVYAAADDFTDELQRLAMITACIGQYNNAQAGNYTLGDPVDYYTPPDIRSYLTAASGDRTRTDTFYGICFDYAQTAYDEIKNNRSRYESLGMKRGGWYIAVAEDNPGRIILPRAQATARWNGVYCKEHSRQNVRTHEGATMHAWLWVYGNDGTVYWIDPTWTDNTGYVWWGTVRDGREVQGSPLASLSKVTVNPNDPSFAVFNSGNASKNQSKWDEAIAEYTEALRINPNNARAYYNRGLAYYTQKDYSRAIADYTQAIRLDPNYAAAYMGRGNAYRGKGDNDRAIADYTQAIRLDPNYAKTYYNRGLAYYYKNDYDRAIADYTQAIRLDPNYAAAYYNRGNAYRGKGDNDRAIADYTQAIRLNPNYVAAYVNRGNAYSGKGDNDRAIADYTQAIRLDPNYANAYYSRGNVYSGKGDNDRAIADYEAALRINPNYANAREWLGKARQARGR